MSRMGQIAAAIMEGEESAGRTLSEAERDHLIQYTKDRLPPLPPRPLISHDAFEVLNEHHGRWQGCLVGEGKKDILRAENDFLCALVNLQRTYLKYN